MDRGRNSSTVLSPEYGVIDVRFARKSSPRLARVHNSARYRCRFVTRRLCRRLDVRCVRSVLRVRWAGYFFESLIKTHTTYIKVTTMWVLYSHLYALTHTHTRGCMILPIYIYTRTRLLIVKLAYAVWVCARVRSGLECCPKANPEARPPKRIILYYAHLYIVYTYIRKRTGGILVDRGHRSQDSARETRDGERWSENDERE